MKMPTLTKKKEVFSGINFSFKKGYLIIKVETGKYEDITMGVFAGHDKNGKPQYVNKVSRNIWRKTSEYEAKIKLKKILKIKNK